ncbi:MAG: hypothetical protein Roseis2KO_41750 [Roseivirga sp.]
MSNCLVCGSNEWTNHAICKQCGWDSNRESTVFLSEEDANHYSQMLNEKLGIMKKSWEKQQGISRQLEAAQSTLQNLNRLTADYDKVKRKLEKTEGELGYQKHKLTTATRLSQDLRSSVEEKEKEIKNQRVLYQELEEKYEELELNGPKHKMRGAKPMAARRSIVQFNVDEYGYSFEAKTSPVSGKVCIPAITVVYSKNRMATRKDDDAILFRYDHEEWQSKLLGPFPFSQSIMGQNDIYIRAFIKKVKDGIIYDLNLPKTSFLKIS